MFEKESAYPLIELAVKDSKRNQQVDCSESPLDESSEVEGVAALAAGNLRDVEAVREPNLEVLVHAVEPCVVEQPVFADADASLDCSGICKLVLAGPVDLKRLSTGALEGSFECVQDVIVVSSFGSVVVIASNACALLKRVDVQEEVTLIVLEEKVDEDVT